MIWYFLMNTPVHRVVFPDEECNYSPIDFARPPEAILEEYILEIKETPKPAESIPSLSNIKISTIWNPIGILGDFSCPLLFFAALVVHISLADVVFIHKK